MFTLRNIFICLIILLVLNNIRFNRIDKFNGIKRNKEDGVYVKKKIPTYGDIQYETMNDDNNDKTYKYQNFDIIKYQKKLEYSDDKNPINKYNDLTKLNNQLPKINKDIIYTEQYKGRFIKTNMPSEQDIIYDTKFFQPSDADTYNPFDPTKIVYNERKIQDVYDDLVNNVHKGDKKMKQKVVTKMDGGFGEKTLKNVMWEYENETDGMSYDPSSSNLLAI